MQLDWIIDSSRMERFSLGSFRNNISGLLSLKEHGILIMRNLTTHIAYKIQIFGKIWILIGGTFDIFQTVQCTLLFPKRYR